MANENKKVFISQPMEGKTEDEILATREQANAGLKAAGYEVVNSTIDEGEAKPRSVMNESLYNLAKSLEVMSECDTVFFCQGWRNARGCRVEHKAAVDYGMTIIEFKETPVAHQKEEKPEKEATK